MSTYYQYEDVKVMIAHKLMKMEGWKVSKSFTLYHFLIDKYRFTIYYNSVMTYFPVGGRIKAMDLAFFLCNSIKKKSSTI